MNALDTLQDQKRRMESSIERYEENTSNRDSYTYKQVKSELEDVINVIKYLEPNCRTNNGQFTTPVVSNSFCGCGNEKHQRIEINTIMCMNCKTKLIQAVL